MSRSHSIWLVYDEFNAVRGAFTVKHQMVTFLREHPDDLSEWAVVRRPDGFLGPQARNFSIKKLLA